MKNNIPEDSINVGKMQVRSVTFTFVEAGTSYNYEKKLSTSHPAHWRILAEIVSKDNIRENMCFNVEQGVGQKLAEVLMPVIVADASRKAQQLADESKAMIQQLGDRAIQVLCEPTANTAS